MKNSFWVVDRADNPLSKQAADLTAERLGDFIVYCTPSNKVPTPFCRIFAEDLLLHPNIKVSTDNASSQTTSASQHTCAAFILYMELSGMLGEASRDQASRLGIPWAWVRLIVLKVCHLIATGNESDLL